MAVVSHLAKDHTDQDLEIGIDFNKLNLKILSKAVNTMNAPDADYAQLYEL